MAYYEITDAQIAPNAPITSRVAYQLRDNTLAIAAGEDDTPFLAPPRIAAFGVAGVGAWTCPADVYRVRLTLIGAGGGGGPAGTTGMPEDDPTPIYGGGGGGGGLVVVALRVVPGTAYPVEIGAGGASDVAGGDTWFGDATDIFAEGGAAGVNTGAGGAGGDGNIVAAPTDTIIMPVAAGIAGIARYGENGQPGYTTGVSGADASGFAGKGGSAFMAYGPYSGAGVRGCGGAGAVSGAGGAGGDGVIIIEY